VHHKLIAILPRETQRRLKPCDGDVWETQSMKQKKAVKYLSYLTKHPRIGICRLQSEGFDTLSLVRHPASQSHPWSRLQAGMTRRRKENDTDSLFARHQCLSRADIPHPAKASISFYTSPIDVCVAPSIDGADDLSLVHRFVSSIPPY